MCEEVNARHAAQPGSGSIALYRRLKKTEARDSY